MMTPAELLDPQIMREIERRYGTPLSFYRQRKKREIEKDIDDEELEALQLSTDESTDE